MKRNHWLISMSAAVAILVAGCGGAAQQGSAPTPVAQTSPSTPSQAEAAAATPLTFEVIKESTLPAELATWKEMRKLPKSTPAARIGDELYVLVAGGTESIGATAIAVQQVEMVEKPTPTITVRAVVSGGSKQGEEVMTFPRSYIRIPYAASLPVPTVGIQVQAEAAKGEPAPVTTPPTPAVNPSTPVSSPAGNTASNPGQPAHAPSAADHGPLAVKALTAADLPASLSAWSTSTVQVPGGVAQFVDSTLYVMVTAGQRNSGGYRVEIRSIEVRENTVFVKAVLQSPRPGQMVTQAITYPKAFAAVSLAGHGQPNVIVDWEK